MAGVKLPTTTADMDALAARKRRFLPRWMKRKNVGKVLLYSVSLERVLGPAGRRVPVGVRPFWVLLFLLLLPYPLYLLLAKDATAPLNHLLLHFLTFLTLTTCLFYSISLPSTTSTSTTQTTRFSPLFRRLPLLLSASLSSFAAITTELIQSLLPYKSFDVLDVLSNLAGAGLALLVCTYAEKRRRERRELSMFYQPLRLEDEEEDEDEVDERMWQSSFEQAREEENPWVSAEDVFSLGDEEEGDMTPRPR
ncbi:hypothetical protein BT69DRAFT_1289031 [Atractiella rhizophila]|nr:hypothetical protein BT69DRAFT_1289031 [Atractiella rhizophila]